MRNQIVGINRFFASIMHAARWLLLTVTGRPLRSGVVNRSLFNSVANRSLLNAILQRGLLKVINRCLPNGVVNRALPNSVANQSSLNRVANRSLLTTLFLAYLNVVTVAWQPPQIVAGDWPGFRGSTPTAVFRGGEEIPPVLEPEKQLRWKAPLPGRGPSSPIVVGGKVIVTAAEGYRQQELHILAFDAETGRQEWDFRFWATGSTVCNPFGGVAAATPFCDGRRIVASFSSNDLVCLDMDGRPLWFRALARERPLLRNDVGMASSPLIVEGTVVFQAESLLDAAIFGLDAETGQTVWLIERPKEALWTTPVVVRPGTPSADQKGNNPVSDNALWVMLQSRKDYAAVDPKTGNLVTAYPHWCDTICSAAVDGDLIALPAAGIHALRAKASPPQLDLLWISDRLRCGNSSPLLWQNKVYLVKEPNIFTCADFTAGDILRQLRLRGSFWASPVLVGRTIYVVSFEGTVFVLRLDENGLPQQIGQWELESGVLASPAVDNTAIYFRTHRWLYRFDFPRPGAQ